MCSTQVHLSRLSLSLHVTAMWLYTPVCVRLSDSDRVSGICVVKVEGSHLIESFCLSICHLPLSHLRIHVAAPQLHNDIVWHDASLAAHTPIFLPSDELFQFLRESSTFSFNLFPLETRPRATLLDIQAVKLKCTGIYTAEAAWAFSPLELGDASVSDFISIRSCPFSFTVPVAFADFVSYGNINCMLRGSKISGYLSDVKYLENMAGSIVSCGDTSIGMVAGNLRKKNGDGDLVVVILWHQLYRQLQALNEDESLPPLILHPIGKKSPMPAPLNTVSLSPSARFLESNRVGPVLPVAVSTNDGDSWGSCVLLDDRTIATNYHVVKRWLDSEDGVCSILLPDRTISLGGDNQVVVPSKNLDLVFLRVSMENQLHLSQVKSTKIGKKIVRKGDLIKAVGYGLFLNRRQLEPLASKGRVSAVIEARPFSAEDKMPCMLIATALCWNGSSGGGLFDSEENLVGILCSNAQVFAPSVDNEQKAEKIPLFALCIPIELVIACYERAFKGGKPEAEESLRVGSTPILLEVDQLWRLKSFHRETFRRAAKL